MGTRECAVAFDVQRAVGLAQRGDLGNVLQLTCQSHVRCCKIHVTGRSLVHMVTHNALQRLILRLGRVQQFAVEGWILSAKSVAGLTMRCIPISLRDVLAIHACDNRTFLGEIVVVHTDKNERRNDQQDQQEHHYFRVLADGFKHGQSIFLATKEKANLAFAFAWAGWRSYTATICKSRCGIERIPCKSNTYKLHQRVLSPDLGDNSRLYLFARLVRALLPAAHRISSRRSSTQ